MDPGVHSDSQIGLQTRFLTSKLHRSGESGSLSWAPGHDSGSEIEFPTFSPKVPKLRVMACLAARSRKEPSGGQDRPKPTPRRDLGTCPKLTFRAPRAAFRVSSPPIGPFVAQSRPIRANRQPFERSEAPLSAAGLEARSGADPSRARPLDSGPENDPRRLVLGL